ncbi:MAG: hypothetical protein ABFD25_00830 [Clostridiaceae bacterium]
MDKCIHNNGEYCEKLSDSEVKQTCIEGSCKDEMLLGDICYMIDNNDSIVKCEVIQTVIIANQCMSCTLKSIDCDVMWESVEIPLSEFGTIFNTYDEAIEAWNRRRTDG